MRLSACSSLQGARQAQHPAGLSGSAADSALRSRNGSAIDHLADRVVVSIGPSQKSRSDCPSNGSSSNTASTGLDA